MDFLENLSDTHNGLTYDQWGSSPAMTNQTRKLKSFRLLLIWIVFLQAMPADFMQVFIVPPHEFAILGWTCCIAFLLFLNGESGDNL